MLSRTSLTSSAFATSCCSRFTISRGVYARGETEALGAELGRGANPGRRIVHRARLGFGGAHEVLHSPDILVWRDHQYLRQQGQRRNADEVADSIIGCVGIGRGCDGVRRRM